MDYGFDDLLTLYDGEPTIPELHNYHHDIECYARFCHSWEEVVVFVEEMLHLALAANLLNAVGGRPRLDSPRMLPIEACRRKGR